MKHIPSQKWPGWYRQVSLTTKGCIDVVLLVVNGAACSLCHLTDQLRVFLRSTLQPLKETFPGTPLCVAADNHPPQQGGDEDNSLWSQTQVCTSTTLTSHGHHAGQFCAHQERPPACSRPSQLGLKSARMDSSSFHDLDGTS